MNKTVRSNYHRTKHQVKNLSIVTTEWYYVSPTGRGVGTATSQCYSSPQNNSEIRISFRQCVMIWMGQPPMGIERTRANVMIPWRLIAHLITWHWTISGSGRHICMCRKMMYHSLLDCIKESPENRALLLLSCSRSQFSSPKIIQINEA